MNSATHHNTDRMARFSFEKLSSGTMTVATIVRQSQTRKIALTTDETAGLRCSPTAPTNTNTVATIETAGNRNNAFHPDQAANVTPKTARSQDPERRDESYRRRSAGQAADASSTEGIQLNLSAEREWRRTPAWPTGNRRFSPAPFGNVTRLTQAWAWERPMARKQQERRDDEEQRDRVEPGWPGAKPEGQNASGEQKVRAGREQHASDRGSCLFSA